MAAYSLDELSVALALIDLQQPVNFQQQRQALLSFYQQMHYFDGAGRLLRPTPQWGAPVGCGAGPNQ